MKIRKWINYKLIIPVILFYSGIITAQDFSVSNVKFEQRGESIIVQYDLIGNRNNKYKISLLLSDDYGKTYNLLPRTVEGDIGKNIEPGTNKQIIWFLKRDISEGLHGEGFVFAVDAELQKGVSKLPYYLLGAGVVGGIVYFVTKSNGKDQTTEPTTGSISITITGDIQE